MVERLGEMRDGRRERIEKGSIERIEIERKVSKGTQGSSQKILKRGVVLRLSGFSDHIKDSLPQKGGLPPSFPLWLDPWLR